MNTLVSTLVKEDGEQSHKLEDIAYFIQSLTWQCYHTEMVFGESVLMRYKTYLTEEQAAEYYSSGTSRLSDVRSIDFSSQYERERWGMDTQRDVERFEEETGEQIVMLLVTQQSIKPEDLGDASNFNISEPPPESWSIPAPPGMKYLPFQRASIWQMIHRPNLLLADDMGLGKTVQTVGMLNYLEPDRVVIIATAGLKKVWLKELHNWLTYKISIREMKAADMLKYRKGQRGIYITNYEAIRSEEARDFLHDHWDQVVLDESHNIKNFKSKTARAILGTYDRHGKKMPGLQSKRKIMLSGTPIPNRAEELWTTLQYLYPEIFKDEIFPDFKREFTSNTSRGYVRNARVLRKWFRAISIRRRKANMLKDLPPKERNTQMVSVSAANLTRLHEMENAALAEAFGGLKQSIAFTEWSAIRAECARIKAGNNAEFMLHFLYENPTEKIVMFRHHAVTRKALSEALNVCGFEHVYYEGGQTPEQKEEAVFEFQNNPNCRAIIVSIKAGGLGITLTDANHAVFAEIDCVPSSLLQCEDRLHRIGQKRDVKVTYLYIHGSIEEHMAHIVAAKLPQIEAVVDDDDVKREHLVEAEIDLGAILVEFRKDQQGWNRLRDIHDILVNSTRPDGHGGIEKKYDWHIIGRFREYYPEYIRGIPKKEREGKKAA